MNISIIYNDFLKVSSYINNVNNYKVGLQRSGFKVSLLPSSKIITDGTVPDFNLCLFLDKDILIAEYLENCGIRVINSSKNIRICDDKALTYITLLNKVTMPKTIVSPFAFGNTVESPHIPFKYPYIIKETKGSLGEQVYLIKNEYDLKSTLSSFKNNRYIVQEYLEGGNSDIRVIVIGGKSVCAMRRTNSTDFRSNAEQGGICFPFSLTREISDMAEKVSKELKLDFCGVDIIISNQVPYLIEINSNPFINNITKVTNTDVAKFLGEYIKKNAAKL